MKSARLAIASALIATFISTSACIAASQLRNLDRDTWIGTYAGQTKLSVRHLSVRRTVLKGQKVYSVQETETSLVGNVLDNKSVSTRYINDHFIPVYEVSNRTWKEGTKDRHKSISVSYNANSIKYTIDDNGRISHKSLPIPKGTDFVASAKYDLGVRTYKVGENIKLCYLDTENLGIKHITVNVIRREKITVKGKKYDTTAIGIDKTPVFWRTNNGTLVKMSIPEFGLTASIETPREGLNSIKNTPANKRIAMRNWKQLEKTFKAGRTASVLMAQNKSMLRTHFANGSNEYYQEEEPQDPNLLRDEWAGIYTDNVKIGYAHTTVRKDEFLGYPAYRRDYVVTFGFPAADGTCNGSEHSIITYCDEDYNPLYILFEESAGDYHKSVEARFVDGLIETKVESDGNITRQTLEIPENSDFRTQTMFKFGAKPVSVGDCFQVEFFNPLSATIGSYTVNVTKREKITLNGETYDAYLTIPTEEPDSPSWQTKDGYFIKSSMCNGHMTWVRETKEQAMTANKIVYSKNSASTPSSNDYYQEETQDQELLRDEWAGIYSDNTKIGYAHTTIRKDKFLGNPAYRRDYRVTFGFPSTDGNSYRSEHSIITYCDEDYNPLCIRFEELSGDSHRSVEGRFIDGVIEVKTETDGNITRQTLEIPAGSDFRTQTMFKFGAKPVSVGDCFQVEFFDPMSATIGSYTVNVQKREKITLSGKSYDAYVTVATEDPDSPSWQTKDGYFIKSTMCNGRVKWFRETKEQAMNSAGTKH